MTDAARTAVAVSILAKDESARLLVLSWGLVEAALVDREALLAWSRVSGVAVRQVERIAPVLLAHGLCKQDRTVDPEALRVCQHVAANYLRSTGGKR
ncbi:MAG: hypothetical protein K8T90_12155 [Planctomycetes bacterium]|nr:hypothetical protein [Planctomycetota bacterium]